MTLSKKALSLLDMLFNEQSSLQIPAGCAEEVIELRKFAKMLLGGEKVGGAKTVGQSENEAPTH